MIYEQSLAAAKTRTTVVVVNQHLQSHPEEWLRNKSTVDTTSQRSDEGSSGKQKVDNVFIDQEACSNLNQQSLISCSTFIK
ncbi:hypothetical protein Hdeb2414_s0007g00244811 [Helianthus debilis subsp. tardiflorus]